MFKKKNIPLILGFSIPILMILFVAASIYIPVLFLHPKYNFLYSTDGDYYGSKVYSVNNGRLVENSQPTPIYPDHRPYQRPELYIHNVTTNESTPASFQEVANLKLEPSTESPDGYKIESDSDSRGFFPFFWYDRDYEAKYIIGHNVSKKLKIKTTGSSYYKSIHFLGWIVE